jgi:hypothetical protein
MPAKAGAEIPSKAGQKAGTGTISSARLSEEADSIVGNWSQSPVLGEEAEGIVGNWSQSPSSKKPPGIPEGFLRTR